MATGMVVLVLVLLAGTQVAFARDGRHAHVAGGRPEGSEATFAAGLSAGLAPAVQSPVEDLSVSVSPAVAGVSDAVYDITFRTSSDGALVAGKGQIEINLPGAEGCGPPDDKVEDGVISDFTGGGERGVGEAGPISCLFFDPGFNPPGGFFTPISIGANQEVQIVTAADMSTPSTAGSHEIEVSTSSDSVAATAEYTLDAKQPTSDVSASVTPSIAGASASQYTIDFKTSSKGQVPVGGHIEVGLPEAESCAPARDNNGGDQLKGTITDLTTKETGEFDCEFLGNGDFFNSPIAIGAGDEVRITTPADLTTPSTTGTHTVTVATSTDSVSSGSYQVVNVKQPLSDLTASVAPPVAGAAGASYDLRFHTSAQGALANNFGTFTVTVPGQESCGEIFDAFVDDLTTGLGAFANCGTFGGETFVDRRGSGPLTFDSAEIGEGDEVELRFGGVQNPATAGAETVSVSSSSDSAASTSVNLAPKKPLAAASVTLANDASGAFDVPYTVSLTTSTVGALLAHQGTVTLEFPPGTRFGECSDILLEDATSHQSEAPFDCSPAGSSLTFTVPFAVAPGDELKIGLDGMTNTEAVGPQQVAVSTSSDQPIAAAFTTVQGFEVKGVVSYQGEQAVEPVVGSMVQACSTNQCVYATTPTNGQGEYGLELPEAGEYTVTAFAPASNAYPVGTGSTRSPGTVGGKTTVNITLPPLTPLPEGVSFNGLTSTVPSVYWSSPAALTVEGCRGGVGIAVMSSTDWQTNYPDLALGPLTETPSGSGTYTTTVPPLYPSHGTAAVSTLEDCGPETALLPSSGPSAGDNTVQLNGSGFTGATAVMFGDTPALSFTVASDSQIDAVAPPGSGTVAVSVVTPVGDISSVGLAQYTYLHLGSASPGTGPSGGGTNVTIEGAGLGNVEAVYFGDSAAENVEVVSDSEITATAPAGAGTVPVTVLDSDGGQSSPGEETFTYEAGAGAASVGRAGDPSTGVASDRPASRRVTGSIAPTTTTTQEQVPTLARSGLFASPWATGGPMPDALDSEGFEAVEKFFTDLNVAGDILDHMAHNCDQGQSAGTAFINGVQSAYQQLVTDLQDDGAWTMTLLQASGGAAATTVAFWDTFAGGAAFLAGGVTAAELLPVGVAAYLAYEAFTKLENSDETTAQIEAVVKCVKKSLPGHAPQMKCPGGRCSRQGFPVRIDPSGAIEDANGAPLSGAAVTLLRSENAVGPFTAPPSGSPIMEPSINPETSDADGLFHWDVFPGFYQVTVGKSECSAPGDSTQPIVSTSVFPVPPPEDDLVLTLRCPDEAPPTRPTVTGLSDGSGPAKGGTQIDVEGTGFTSSAAVSFGGVPAATTTVLSPTDLVATVPAGTGNVDVKVITAGGASNASEVDRYTYIGAPTVTGVSPAFGPREGDTSVTIAGSGFGAGDRVEFGGVDAQVVTVVSGEEIWATAPAGTGTVDVTVTNEDGSSMASSADRYTYESEAPPTEEPHKNAGSEGGPTPTTTGLSVEPPWSTAPMTGGTGRGGVLAASTTKPLTLAQRLARALAGCKKIRNRRKRSSCVAKAEKQYKAQELAQALKVCDKLTRTKRSRCIAAARKKDK